MADLHLRNNTWIYIPLEKVVLDKLIYRRIEKRKLLFYYYVVFSQYTKCTCYHTFLVVGEYRKNLSPLKRRV
jgi:hypothetical protein